MFSGVIVLQPLHPENEQLLGTSAWTKHQCRPVSSDGTAWPKHQCRPISSEGTAWTKHHCRPISSDGTAKVLCFTYLPSCLQNLLSSKLIF